MSKRLEVYQAIVALAIEGVCEATQAEIAARAGVRRQHVIPILRYLEKSRMIEVVKTDSHYGPGARRKYVQLSPQNRTQSNETESAKPDSVKATESAKPDSVEQLSPQNRTQSNKNGTMNHDMNDMKKIINELNFIASKNRKACAALLDLPTARRWRELWEYCEANDAWGEYGVKTNGVGYIVRLIKNGDPVPDPVQNPLPAGAIDLSPFVSRGMTRAEIEAKLSVNGATLGEDGIWR